MNNILIGIFTLLLIIIIYYILYSKPKKIKVINKTSSVFTEKDTDQSKLLEEESKFNLIEEVDNFMSLQKKYINNST